MSVLKSFVAVAILTALSIANSKAGDAPKKSAQTDTYPLKTCVVSGEELGGEMGGPFVIQYKGRTVKLCCDSCQPKFNKDPEKYLKKLDEAAAAAKGGK
jgi:YHS domain-containing protein